MLGTVWMLGKGDSPTQRSVRGEETRQKKKVTLESPSFNLIQATNYSLCPCTVPVCLLHKIVSFGARTLFLFSFCTTLVVTAFWCGCEAAKNSNNVTNSNNYPIFQICALILDLSGFSSYLWMLSYLKKKKIPYKMALFLFGPHGQIIWSDYLLHQFQEETKIQWTYYWVKHYSHCEFMVMGKLEFFFFLVSTTIENAIIFIRFQCLQHLQKNSFGQATKRKRVWGKEIIIASAINVSTICMLELLQITLPPLEVPVYSSCFVLG